ncbi:MAG: bile acid:sodium symporter family protein [Chitinophagales bacterium]|nr:bile acid:sodium symporter family protein [Chitinophagales bacterium]
MQGLEQIQINFSDDNIFILNICLGFLMFGIALDMKKSDFGYLLEAPKSLLTGMVSQLILLPIMTIGLIWLIRPEYSLALGMALIASCPGGNVSNYAVHLSKANTALSILLTSISTLACVVTTPLIFKLIQKILPTSTVENYIFDISFADMATVIFQLIIVPLIIGFSLNHYFPKWTEKIKTTVKRLSFIIFIGFVIVAVINNLDNLFNYLHIVFFLVILHNSLALTTGYWWSKKVIGLSVYDSRAISIETGIQNSGLALILIFNFFDGNGGMALIAAWWSIWHLISAGGIALWWRSQENKLIAAQNN